LHDNQATALGQFSREEGHKTLIGDRLMIGHRLCSGGANIVEKLFSDPGPRFIAKAHIAHKDARRRH
jgi:hypothetical protein